MDCSSKLRGLGPCHYSLNYQFDTQKYTSLDWNRWEKIKHQSAKGKDQKWDNEKKLFREVKSKVNILSLPRGAKFPRTQVFLVTRNV